MMTENFPNLVKEKDKLVQEAIRFPIKISQNRPTTRHIIVKKAKFKDKRES